MEHMLKFVMWTSGHLQHEQDLHWLECDYDGKGDFHHIRPYVNPSDRKVAQTTMFNGLDVVGVFMVVFRPITTFIPTKHNSHWIKSKDTRMNNPSLQKWPMEKVYRLSNHTKYIQGDYLSSDFSQFVEGANSFV